MTYEMSPARLDKTLETVDALIAEAFAEGRIELQVALDTAMALGTLQYAYNRLLQIEEELE